MSYIFRLAVMSELDSIWTIIQSAIQRRSREGSNQWQDGYPNREVITHDIENSIGYVLTVEDEIVGYVAVLINDEPEYARLEGKWITENDFVVFHRVAVAEKHLGKGFAKQLFLEIEKFSLSKNIFSIKADTNHDNNQMLYLFEKLGYKHCGRVYFRGSPREAYEKVLIK